FWTDADHERGLWRRTTLDSYRSEDPQWEILLDVDALNAAEDEDWVWHGARLLRPAGLAEGEPYRRALIDLSHGGSDADVTREFGEGTLTTSGYPRQARLWRRGTAMGQAQLVFEAAETDMSVFVGHDSTPGWERDWVVQMHAFYDTSLHLVDRSQSPPALTRIEVPRDLEANAHRDLGIFSPRSDWEIAGSTYPAGSLVVGDF